MAKTKEKELSLKEKKSKSSVESGVKVYSKGIGKFINPKLKKEEKSMEEPSGEVVPKKKKKDIKSSFQDFSAW